MTKHLTFILAAIMISIFAISCEKEDPFIPNEEELITTLTYTLTPTSGGASTTLTFVDLDGDGGDEPTITGGVLQANTTYSGELDLLNESETPTESITEEILEEADDHQFFFQTDIAGLTIGYDDIDSDDNPLGLATTLTTGNIENGTLTITLRHEPTKTAEGVAAGMIANAGGETDIEVSFPIDVE